jgi:hypothetical protein
MTPAANFATSSPCVVDTVANLPPVSSAGGKLPPVLTTPAANFATSSPCVVATGINDTDSKFAAGDKLPPVLTTPAANFATSSPCVVDTGGNDNNGNNIRLQTPESELEGKNLYMCFLYYPKVTKQIIKIFLIEDFSICHRCQRHRWQTLSCEYLLEFSK